MFEEAGTEANRFPTALSQSYAGPMMVTLSSLILTLARLGLNPILSERVFALWTVSQVSQTPRSNPYQSPT